MVIDAVGRFTVPRTQEKIVRRDGVAAAISGAIERRGAAEIAAPAGYGKSTAALLWLAESGLRAAWMTIDQYDDSPALFYRRLCSALLSLHARSAALRRTVSSPDFDGAPVELTIDALLKTAGGGSPRVLVLDDVHLITHREILRSLPLVLKRLPAGDMVLTIRRCAAPSSERPPAELRSIGAELLKFSAAETQECFAQAGRAISSEEAGEAARICDGWPIAIRSMAACDVAGQGATKEQILTECIRRRLWDPCDADERSFLIKLSVLDETTPELAALLCGVDEDEAGARLDNMARENAMIRVTADGYYVPHALLLDFLRERWGEEGFDGRALCDVVSDYYFERSDDYRGTSYAFRGRAGMERVISAMSVRPDDRVRSVAEHAGRLGQYVLGFVPADVMRRYPFFYINFAWHSYLTGDAPMLEHYLDALSAAIPTIAESYPGFLEMAMMAMCIDHRLSVDDLCESFAAIAELAPPEAASEHDEIQVSSITQNLPLIHRSAKDFSHLAPALRSAEGLSHFRAVFGVALREDYDLVEAEMTGGLLYEMNDLPGAFECAKRACELYERSNMVPELGFAARMLLATVLDAMGRDGEARSCRAAISRAISSENAHYLSQNMLAYDARLRMENGDMSAGEEWLGQYFVDCDGPLALFRIYQHMTTARALIARGKAPEARDFIARLSRLASDFARPLDAAEAKTLAALLEWHLGSKDAAMAHLAAAIELVREYRFVRVFADEGASLLPLLRKLAVGHQLASGIDPSFVADIIHATQLRAKKRPGIAAAISPACIRLSKQQRRILALLADGMGLNEISREANLAYNTVKVHCAQIYRKLHASGARNAVARARKLGLLDDRKPGAQKDR